eukprot:scaffold393707_cov86-Cyclotella_meneghiniana.AAC.1
MSSDSGSVSVVVQRFRKCKLLIDELEYVEVGACEQNCSGLLAYISFASSTSISQVQQAATTLLNLPVLTTGLWGDSESSTLSVLSLAAEPTSLCSLVVVPQANLISKVKQQGKSIQYHGQINKEKGKELYDCFCDCIRAKLLEEQCSFASQELPQWYMERKAFIDRQNNNSQPACVSKLPELLFRVESKYSEWDDRGIPVKDLEGNELSKSQQKKLNKIYEAHCRRHQKWKESGGHTESSKEDCNDNVPKAEWDASLDPSFCRFVAGSFGKRQGLSFESDMGPFVVSTP